MKIDKVPTCELVNELSILELEINLNILKYNIYAKELTRRFPFLEKEDSFKQKKLVLKGFGEGEESKIH